MNTIPRYFDFGNGAKLENGIFKYDECQPLSWVKVGEDASNILPEILKNSYITSKYFLFDLLEKELLASNEDFGVPFSKNVKRTTGVIFSHETNKLTVFTHKSYSRRIEKKRSEVGYHYPSFYIKNRVKWFLEKNPFVKSFRMEKSVNGFSEQYSFFISWK